MHAASAEEIALLRRWIEAEGISLFSELCRLDLARLMGSRAAVALLEAQCTIGEYSDVAKHQVTAAAVARILRRSGVKLGRGKRTNRALEAFTRSVAEVAVSQGVKPATGDNSRMVTILRRIAAELEIPGDPRDELRRIARIDKRASGFAYQLVLEAARRGVCSD